MKKASELNPKLYQQLLSKIKNGEDVSDLLSNYDPYALRDLLEESAAEASKNKHPFDLFEKPEIFKNVSIKEEPNLKDYGELRYKKDPKTGFALPDEPMTIALKNKKDMGSAIHEAQHAYDLKTRPETELITELPEAKALKKIKEEQAIVRNIKSVKDLKGLDEGTEFWAKHFAPDVEESSKLKQLLNFERIAANRPLKNIAAMAGPLVKGLGIAGAGLAATSIANKAMAGEYPEATKEALDLATDINPTIMAAKASLLPQDIGKTPESEAIENPNSLEFKRKAQLEAIQRMRGK